MTEENYLVVATNAVDMLGDNIELILGGNKLTDAGYTNFNVITTDTEDQWNATKLNKLIGVYGCKIVNDEIVYESCKELTHAITAMIQAITAIETYLYHASELENDK